MSGSIRWSVTVSKETDSAIRSYLAEHGSKKGELSKLIERAVTKEVLRATINEIQQRNASLPTSEVQALIDDACASVRADFWPKRRPECG